MTPPPDMNWPWKRGPLANQGPHTSRRPPIAAAAGGCWPATGAGPRPSCASSAAPAARRRAPAQWPAARCLPQRRAPRSAACEAPTKWCWGIKAKTKQIQKPQKSTSNFQLAVTFYLPPPPGDRPPSRFYLAPRGAIKMLTPRRDQIKYRCLSIILLCCYYTTIILWLLYCYYPIIIHFLEYYCQAILHYYYAIYYTIIVTLYNYHTLLS